MAQVTTSVTCSVVRPYSRVSQNQLRWLSRWRSTMAIVDRLVVGARRHLPDDELGDLGGPTPVGVAAHIGQGQLGEGLADAAQLLEQPVR